jgi:hypothetical protein
MGESGFVRQRSGKLGFESVHQRSEKQGSESVHLRFGTPAWEPQMRWLQLPVHPFAGKQLWWQLVVHRYAGLQT